jgi:protein involved in polysaccharide export with SLBB domain
MEGPVDPAEYIVGPSDVFYVAVWGPMSLSHQITVTPEGTLIIPTVGELAVAGKSLERVKTEVREAVRAKYRIGEITVTLMSTREFTVTVKGAVLREGQYTVSAVDRVEKLLIQSAGRESPRPTVTLPQQPFHVINEIETQQAVEVPQVRISESIDDRASIRNIQLQRRNGEVVRVDLLRCYATGDNRFNPFLLDGDVVFVPSRNLSKNFVTVDGAVHAPGRYEFVEGDDLMTLLAIAQGFTVNADSGGVVILRQNDQGEIVKEIAVDIRSIVRKRLPWPTLQRGDRILVKSLDIRKSNHAVIISGEVVNPGRYPISRNGTKLSKIIRDAGGVTANALLSGSVVLRKEERLEGLIDPRLNLVQLMRTGYIKPVDSSYYQTEFEIGRYPVVVDFHRLLMENDSTQDLVLRDGDIIHIASNHETVLVQGQVVNPGYIAYVPQANLEYYLRIAGGLTEVAERGEIKVIKKGTMTWIDPAKTTITPGDRIWVPKRPHREFDYYLRTVSDVASIVAAVTTTILLAIRIAQ